LLQNDAKYPDATGVGATGVGVGATGVGVGATGVGVGVGVANFKNIPIALGLRNSGTLTPKQT
jgi:hypothetical protein